MTDLLRRIDSYLDATPRTAAAPEDVGPFTLFRPLGPFPYYARPRFDATVAVTTADVEQLAARCRELELPVSIEWVTELVPSLAPAARAAGLAVVEYPLLALEVRQFTPAPIPAGFTVRLVGADEPELLVARAVADVGFGAGGTEVGVVGTSERDERRASAAPEIAAHLGARAAMRLSVTAVAEAPQIGVVAVGTHQPVDTTSEVVGVATLPAFRRRGLAVAVTSALVADAFAHDADLVLLSADSEAVARVYRRLGFRPVGHAGAAEPV